MQFADMVVSKRTVQHWKFSRFLFSGSLSCPLARLGLDLRNNTSNLLGSRSQACWGLHLCFCVRLSSSVGNHCEVRLELAGLSYGKTVLLDSR